MDPEKQVQNARLKGFAFHRDRKYRRKVFRNKGFAIQFSWVSRTKKRFQPAAGKYNSVTWLSNN
jgi:hypothetical protein